MADTTQKRLKALGEGVSDGSDDDDEGPSQGDEDENEDEGEVVASGGVDVEAKEEVITSP